MNLDQGSSVLHAEHTAPWHSFALGLGSNLGSRGRHLQAAIAALGGLDGIVVEQVSSWIETAPEGGPKGQGPYLNGALCGRTQLVPRALLRVLLGIEKARGRIRLPGRRNEPRPLDLDLLLFGIDQIQEPDLVVPHPRLVLREFVLLPLAEIAADWVIPPGNSNVQEHLTALQETTGVVSSVHP